ncbi:MAG TPA: DUF2092 domain-containing protein [Variovorax sp.]
MTRKLLVSALIAMSIGAPSLHAQPAAPAAAPASPPAQASAPASPSQPEANPVDPDAIQALKDMGAQLQSLKRFDVSIELTGERVLADGQKLQHTATASMQIERPNRMRVAMRSARKERELIYDGKTVTLYTPAQHFYSQVAFTEHLGDLITQLKQKFGVEVPATDLFAWGTPAAPFDNIQSAMLAGQDYIGNELCDLYAFRQGDLDWQVWISASGKPLPHKLVITYRADEARPQSVTLIDWNLNPTFKDTTFTFVPPKGAREIPLVPLKRQ